MPIATNAMKEALATAYGTTGTYLSLHSADPGTTGSSEATGGSPAYARKALAWTPGASDGVNAAAAVTFDLAANQAVTHVGLWSAATGGTFLDKVAVTYATQAVQSTLTVTPSYTQS